METRGQWRTAVYVAALVWLNAYWCRDVFFFDHIGHMNSMHGFWMGLSRLAGSAWLKPTWWRYSYGGMPYEYTYAPLVPTMIAGISKVTGWSEARAFGAVAGFVFCFGPVAMFLMSKELTRRAGWSFVAVLAYCLFAPTQLLAPDENFALRHLLDARRVLLTFYWDDVPHELALALICIAVLFLVRGLRVGKPGSFVWAGFFIALALLSNAFGTTGTAIALLGLIVTWDTGSRRKIAGAVAASALGAYLAMCPFLPPSLIAVIGRNANNSVLSAWTWKSFVTLAGVAGVSAGLWLVSRRWQNWHLRLFLLLAFVFSAIPVLDQRNLHFLPEPERYKVEMEVWLALLATFAVAPFIDRAPKSFRISAAVLLLIPAGVQVKSHRIFARAMTRPADASQTLEYRVAAWLHANLPDARVFAPGTIGQWMNAFTDQQQLGGGSFPTIPSLPIQLPIIGLTYLDTPAEVADWGILWLRAFGVDAIDVPGRNSPEYWKPFRGPEAFSGTLPLLWRERDTSIYEIPRRNGGLAHVIPESAIVKDPPKDFFDMAAVRAYVSALENPDDPSAEWRWIDDNHGRIRTRMRPGEVISLQITYHAGWSASAGGKRATVTPDGLGQMVIRTECGGDCEVQLGYDGGWEGKGLRVVSLITILGATLLVSARALRRRKLHQG